MCSKRHEEVSLAHGCLEREGDGEVGARTALLERLLAVAAVQGRRRDDALPHFEASLRLGREHGADYEVGRTLQAKVVTGFASGGELEEAEAIMERLGVASLPYVPLP
jgi:hypothetical protein